MGKLFNKSILCSIICLALMFFILNAASFAQEKKAESKKAYDEIVGKYEFDVEGQVRVIAFWFEDGKLWGGSEGEEPAELEPVEEEELKFTGTTSEGQFFEIAFARDDKGKVAKCVIGTQGMEYEGLLCIPVMMSAQEKDALHSITREELRDQIFFLASDELEGRDTGSEGFAIAALYAVTQFKMSGLEPLIVGKDEKKTFFQSVPFSSYDVSNKSAFTISSSAGETNLFHADKMVLFRNPSLGKNIFVDENPVFLGYGIDDPEIGWSDYDDVDVRGKVVFVVGGAPSKDGKPVFSPEKDRFYRNFGRSVNIKVVSALKHGVSNIVIVPDPETAKNWFKGIPSMIRRQFGLLLKDNKRVDSPALFFMHPDAVTEMLKNAGYDWTYGDHDYKPAVLENIKVSCSVEKDNEEVITCKNIISMLPGTDPQLKEEYIMLHAHLDHLGVNSNGQVMNGADDDASGCAVVLEVAEALAMKPAKRSFIFVLFTGEEKGTLGSEWFVNNLPVPQEQIVLNAAVDMIGRKSRQKPDVIYVVAEGEGKESLLDIAKRANESRIQTDIDFSLNEKDLDGHIMRCDLRPFLGKNITSLLFTRGFMPPVYHSPRDDAETLNYDKIKKASRLLYLVLAEAGNMY